MELLNQQYKERLTLEKNESALDAIQRILEHKLVRLQATINGNVFANIEKDELIYFNEFILDANRCRGDHDVYLLHQNIVVEDLEQLRSLQSDGIHFIDCDDLYTLLIHNKTQNDIILVRNSNALVWAWVLKCS
eukprot:276982_1